MGIGHNKNYQQNLKQNSGQHSKQTSKKNSKQLSFFKTNWKHQYCHGGLLRSQRKCRGQRPLSCSEPLHLVFKLNKDYLRTKSLRTARNFKLANQILKTYAHKFFVKLEQVSIQHDHIHCLLRTSRRSHYHYFFRVVAGQIAQQFENMEFLCLQAHSPSKKAPKTKVTDTPKMNPPVSGTAKASKDLMARKKKTGLWSYRPFSRVVRGYKAYKIVRNY